MRLLDLVRPFTSLLPEVSKPYHKVDTEDRILYSVAAALFFVLLAEVPLYGTKDAVSPADPIAWLRPALSMSYGTPAELGLLPIVLSGVLIQGLAGLRKINVSLDLRADRVLFQTLQKFVALGIAAVLAVVLAFAPGYYEGANPLFTATQVFFGSAVTIVLDEVLSKGYGYVPGTVLFPLVSASQYFAWQLLGLDRVPVRGTDFSIVYGVIPSFVGNFSSRSYSYAFSDLIFRVGAPNLLSIAAAVAVFCATLYLSLIRLNLQIRSTRMRAQSAAFPVRLFYTGVVPLMFALSVLATVLLLSYAAAAFLGNSNPVVQVLGQWDQATGAPVGGLASLLVPAYSTNPLIVALRAVACAASLGFTSAYIANVWVKSSGFAPADIAKQFKEQSIVLVGKRDVTVAKELRQIVPLAATTGGAILGLFVGTADVLGPAGAGAIMSIAALNVFSVFEQLASEGMSGQDVLQGLMSQ